MPQPNYWLHCPLVNFLILTVFPLDHTFAGNPLDRAESIRRDEGAIRNLVESDLGRYLVFNKSKVLVDGQGQLAWVDRSKLVDIDTEPALLGTLEETPYFALDCSNHDWPTQLTFADCRATAMQITGPETGILAQARSQLEWHKKNLFCGVCGSKNKKERGGQVLRCSGCDRHIFPRTDPVVIMLVIDKFDQDKCLLGQGKGRMVRSNFYSALAGFVDQGESIEEAVRREVQEESDIQVGLVQYHSSQPWPFPSSLMIGCHALASTNEIVVNQSEMANVDWFSKKEVISALNQDHPTLSVPGEIAIAHHLIKSWACGDLKFG